MLTRTKRNTQSAVISRRGLSKKSTTTTNDGDTDSISLEAGTVSFRQMGLADVALCYSIGQKLFSFSPSMSRTFDRFVVINCYSSDPTFCLVAEHENKVIGFALGSTISKQNNSYGYASWVGVEPEYQRQGIGSELYKQMEKRMIQEEQLSEILVDTPTTNNGAIMFFTALGFDNPLHQVYLSKNTTTQDDVDSTFVLGKRSCPTLTEEPSDVKLRKTSLEQDTSLKSASTPVVSDLSNDVLYSDDQLTIRLMTLNDIFEVYQIGNEVFTSQSLNLYRFWDESCVTDAYELDGDLALVATRNNTVIGFALGSTLERIEVTYGYLIWLAVSPSCHGGGVGSKLYNSYESLVKRLYPQVHSIIIDTQANNNNAIKFFTGQGFAIEDTFVVLSKSLTQNENETVEASNIQ